MEQDNKKVPRGIRNNNPLNIRVGNHWQGEKSISSDKEFEQFESMQMGIRAGFKILRQYMSGYGGATRPFNTIELMVKRWAPSTENPTKRYTDFVSKMSGIPCSEPVNFRERNKMVAIVDAMIQFECGQQVAKELIESAYDLV